MRMKLARDGRGVDELDRDRIGEPRGARRSQPAKSEPAGGNGVNSTEVHPHTVVLDGTSGSRCPKPFDAGLYRVTECSDCRFRHPAHDRAQCTLSLIAPLFPGPA